ncbi:hypothetical protein [Enterobacter hormaechei]
MKKVKGEFRYSISANKWRLLLYLILVRIGLKKLALKVLNASITFHPTT